MTFKSGYFTIEEKFSIIDFSDLNNNDDDEYVRRIFRSIDSLLK